MKKRFLGLLCLCFPACILFAQHSVQYGLKGGLNLAALNVNGDSTDHRTGFHLGGLAHIHINPQLALQPEVMYSSQGAENGNGSETKLNYINIPVLLQYMFGDGWRLQTGPQLGILTSAKAQSGNTETTITGNYETADVSWAFGVGYLTRSRLGVDVRYNLGLSDVSKGAADVKNRVWQLGLFYQFLH
jgi:hypothetical protein